VTPRRETPRPHTPERAMRHPTLRRLTQPETATCVDTLTDHITRQARQRARRGRRSPTPRTDRLRACPHGARTPPHGQHNSPSRRRRSTSTTPLPTMTTGALQAPSTALPVRPRNGEGRCAVQNVIRLSSHTNKGHPQAAPRTRHHSQRRSTTAPCSGGVSFNTRPGPSHRSRRRTPRRSARPAVACSRPAAPQGPCR